MLSFTKLKKVPGQPWGVRAEPADDVSAGDRVEVERRPKPGQARGEKQIVVLGEEQMRFEDGNVLFAIAKSVKKSTLAELEMSVKRTDWQEQVEHLIAENPKAELLVVKLKAVIDE